MEFLTASGRSIVLLEDDITRIEADAIVNAANSALAGGGGVDGAIHRAAGPEIMRELDGIRRQIGRCATGDAVVTGAGRLRAKHIFHTVGPVYRDGKHGEAELLASCYRTCLRLAEERGLASIAFPAISTGVYGYPLPAAAEIAVREVVAGLDRSETSIRQAVFVVFDHTAANVYGSALNSATSSRRRT
jgi:O-acetyl-ADP-ribose deacetylase (regulator of RNase III)